jgi:hypothetical protein
MNKKGATRTVNNEKWRVRNAKLLKISKLPLISRMGKTNAPQKIPANGTRQDENV